MAHTQLPIALTAVLLAVLAYAPTADALIEGPGVYYGLELPEPFYNYWNYTSDTKDMRNAYERNNFQAAIDIYTKGKNNRRNETAMRIMYDGAVANRSIEGPNSFFGVYSSYFNSPRYLNDLISPPLFGNGSFSRACCGVRAAALDVYMRLWLIMYAQHETDIGIVLNAAEEASHGFAVVSSPVDERWNYWNSVESYSRLACVAPVKDPITGNNYAASNIKYRDALVEMGPAIDEEDIDKRPVEIARIRAKLERELIVQFMQVVMVEAKKATQIGHQKMNNVCYKTCSKGVPFQAGAHAAWTAISPYAARTTDKAAFNNVSNMLNSYQTNSASKWDRRKWFPSFKSEVEKVAVSLGVNFKEEIWGCKW